MVVMVVHWWCKVLHGGAWWYIVVHGAECVCNAPVLLNGVSKAHSFSFSDSCHAATFLCDPLLGVFVVKVSFLCHCLL